MSTYKMPVYFGSKHIFYDLKCLNFIFSSYFLRSWVLHQVGNAKEKNLMYSIPNLWKTSCYDANYFYGKTTLNCPISVGGNLAWATIVF